MSHWRESTDRETLRAAVAGIKRDCEAAYYTCQDEQAGYAHDDLIAAEWRLRQAERRHG